MSGKQKDVHELLAEIGATAYSPHRLSFAIDVAPLIDSLSLSARTMFRRFVSELAEGRQQLPLPSLYSRPWREERFWLDSFLSLDSTAQQEVLALYTFPLHEFRHHVDFCTTPYGARFFTSLAQEYRCFQNASPLLLQNQEFISPGPLISLPGRMDAVASSVPPEWSASWAEFRRSSENLTATIDTRVGGIDRASIAQVDAEPYVVLDRMFYPVSIYGRVSTFSLENRDGWYMRASTLLEGRAVISSLLWIIDTIGRDHPELRSLLQGYVAANYPIGCAYDYRFLLDFAAWGAGADNLDELLARPLTQVRAALHQADNVAWYALHAGFRDMNGAWAPENMFIRFLLGAHMLLHPTIPLPANGYAVLEGAEGNPDFLAWGLSSTPAALAASLELISAHREQLGQIWQPDMRNHFQVVFDILTTNLARRSNLSMPGGATADGNVVFSLDPELIASLFAPYQPHKWVEQWFEFRNRSLFSATSRKLSVNYLREQFGLGVVYHWCECGTSLEKPVPKWSPSTVIRCPCGRIYRLSEDNVFVIDVDEEDLWQ